MKSLLLLLMSLVPTCSVPIEHRVEPAADELVLPVTGDPCPEPGVIYEIRDRGEWRCRPFRGFNAWHVCAQGDFFVATDGVKCEDGKWMKR